MSYFVSCKLFDLKSVLSSVSTATPALFRLLFAWNIFQFFHFWSICAFWSKVSLLWIAYSWTVIFNHFASLSFGEFNPFTFKRVITGKERLLSPYLFSIHFTALFFTPCITVLSSLVFSWLFFLVVKCLNSFLIPFCLYSVAIFFVGTMGITFNILKL